MSDIDILKERALLLSKPLEKDEASKNCTEYTEFMISNEHYGIENTYIAEVLPLVEYTSLPGTPAFVFGIINVRGQVLSVVDLRVFYDLPKGEDSQNKTVIIIQNDTMKFAVLTDEVVQVKTFSLESLEASFPTFESNRIKYLKGVTKERVIILDSEKLLNDKNIIVHENA